MARLIGTRAQSRRQRRRRHSLRHSTRSRSGRIAAATPRALPASDPNGVTLFAAMREQLGLRLEPTTAKVDLLVVDRVERLTAN